MCFLDFGGLLRISANDFFERVSISNSVQTPCARISRVTANDVLHSWGGAVPERDGAELGEERSAGTETGGAR